MRHSATAWPTPANWPLIRAAGFLVVKKIAWSLSLSNTVLGGGGGSATARVVDAAFVGSTDAGSVLVAGSAAASAGALVGAAFVPGADFSRSRVGCAAAATPCSVLNGGFCAPFSRFRVSNQIITTTAAGRSEE